MAYYGKKETWKIVYYLKEWKNGVSTAVAFVEACDHHGAMHTFQQLYAGQFATVYTCTKLNN